MLVLSAISVGCTREKDEAPSDAEKPRLTHEERLAAARERIEKARSNAPVQEPPIPIEGTADDDTLVGTDARESISGGEGNDHIDGAGGDDELRGGDGDDRLEGGEGNDRLMGSEGNDDLFGGPGDDLVWGQGGADTVRGGTGADELGGQLGPDRFLWLPEDLDGAIDSVGGFEPGVDVIDVSEVLAAAGYEGDGSYASLTGWLDMESKTLRIRKPGGTPGEWVPFAEIAGGQGLQELHSKGSIRVLKSQPLPVGERTGGPPPHAGKKQQ